MVTAITYKSGGALRRHFCFEQLLAPQALTIAQKHESL
jgi:hypothetical protein